MDAETEAARRQMIEQQVRAASVLDARVLEALSAVPRERFVPAGFRAVAFADTAIPIGHGQTMLPPALEGRILQALAPERGERALEIGTGTGFFAACLAQLAGQVESLEIHADLAAGAVRTLAAEGFTGVAVEVADAFARRLEPQYAVIAVTGSLPVYDPRFERALTVGGRLFVVVGSAPAMEARLVTRTGPDSWLAESLFETSIEPLVHATAAPRFRF
ncbi:MAG: protein-L-isoaspartate O-methyltransferase [Steroidobacteraceae bacterium]|nr:protein-L-isoaspartate O-methyltransferase [Steroidobacteraceae bacterium]